MAYGPAAGLDHRRPAAGRAGAGKLPPAFGVRGDLLAKLGRFEEAAAELERAAAMTRNERERELLLQRAAASRLARAS